MNLKKIFPDTDICQYVSADAPAFQALLTDIPEGPLPIKSVQVLNQSYSVHSNLDQLFQKMILEVQDYAFLLLDQQGTILNWNTGARIINGYESDEAIGSNFRILFAAGDRESSLPEKLLSESETRGRALHNGWHVKKDGSRYWGSTVLTSLHDDDQKIIGFSMIMRDISERKTTEEQLHRQFAELQQSNEALRRSEDRFYRMIAEVEDYAIILLDTEGNILNWNKGAENIKGYSTEEIVGTHFSRFYQREDIDAGVPQTLLEQAARTGKSNHEGWRVRKDGKTFWGSVVLTALHDNDGSIIGFSKVTRDLTERKMAEERQARFAVELQYKNELLRRSEERYHKMISEVEDYAIILLDTEGNILNWNRGAEKIKGYSDAEAVGENFSIFYLPEDRDELPQKLLEIARTVGKASHEGWRLRKDGDHFWANVVITALHDDGGDIIGFSKVTRDLTQKKRADEQIQMQNKQLEEYAYVASHDLQEPLRKIQMYSYLLKESLDNREAAVNNLERITAAAQRMSNLISDVLSYAQAEDISELYESVDLNEIVYNVRADFDLLLQQRNGTLTIGDLPTIYAIPIQMHQLFSNLISNSVKFNDRDPQINVFAEESHGKLSVIVEDNGTGFDQQYTEKIFKMFQRASNEKKGTGIGLALCKKIMDNHGGSIDVSSTLGVGTRFELVFDVRKTKILS